MGTYRIHYLNSWKELKTMLYEAESLSKAREMAKNLGNVLKIDVLNEEGGVDFSAEAQSPFPMDLD